MLARENSYHLPNSFTGDTRKLAGYPYSLHIVHGSLLPCLQDAMLGVGHMGQICFSIPFARSSHPQK